MISDNACAASFTMGASLVLPFWLLLLVTTVAMPLTTRMTGNFKESSNYEHDMASQPGSETVCYPIRGTADLAEKAATK